jgi:hypothetical protein
LTKTFTCLDRESFQLFSSLCIDNSERIFNRRLNLRVVENSEGKKFDQWHAPCSSEKLHSLGFDYWLKDLLTGPEDILNTLCHSNAIHALAIAKRGLPAAQHKAIEALTESNGKNIIPKYIAGNERFELVRSRYGNKNVSSTSNTIPTQAKYFSDTGCPFIN